VEMSTQVVRTTRRDPAPRRVKNRWQEIFLKPCERLRQKSTFQVQHFRANFRKSNSRNFPFHVMRPLSRTFHRLGYGSMPGLEPLFAPIGGCRETGIFRHSMHVGASSHEAFEIVYIEGFLVQ